MLIDSHAHLDDEKFDEDRDELINLLKQNGVELVLNPGCDVKTSERSIQLSEKYDMIYAAVGTHPEDADKMDEETLELYKKYALNKKVLAIGEIGLDYYYDNSPREYQRKWFREQVKLAKQLDMPYIVHDRDAHEDVFNIMKEEHYSGARGILHCYSGNIELAKEFIKMGFLISLGGPVTFKNSKVSKKVAFEIPLEHLLIETDSPYLAPEPFRGKRNQPALVKYVAEEIAKIKGVSYDEVVNKTNSNFKRLFKIN
ncbi:TatD family hydrolase [Sedimentibacter sp. zth1]|uniref:TatD family hydrolase n=1 Tax=Sedimentibacter sp. zth1 TaxID=2816908 RepID=UPI001A90CD9B|nr:TatD family hydrolase [Sedimentibacter sp. zth1]QSX04764.1 TatD family hydrolase [Sedimentibacter sp. zth1]